MRAAPILLALLLLAIAGNAFAAPISLDDWRKYQDQLLKAGQGERLLKEFRDRAKAEETALHKFLLGRAYVKLDRHDEARSEFERATEIDPLFAPAYQGLAICMIRRGEVVEAIQALQRGVELDGTDVDSKHMLAELLAGTKRIPAAEELVVQILRQDPKHVQARILYARIHRHQRRPEKAVEELRVVIQQAPGNLQARHLLVECVGMLNDPAGMERELREIIERAPMQPVGPFALTQLLVAQKKFGEARKVLIAYRERKPGAEIEKEIDRALEQMSKMDDGLGDVQTIGDLIDKLETDDVKVRRKVLRHLLRLDFRRGVPRAVVQHVLDKDEEVRVLVIRLMGKAKDRNTLAVLALKLGHEKDKDKSRIVRGACVEALRSLRTEAVVPVLLAALADDSPYVRELALSALRYRCGKRFVPGDPADVATEKADEVRRFWWGWWTSDKAKYRKIRAMKGVTESGLLAMARFVVPLLVDEDPEVFAAAYAAFRSLTKKSFGEPDGSPATRARIAKEARDWWKAAGK